MEIPSMIIQPYIENAIKHGISGKQDEKEIAVEFKQVGTQLFCTIQDNGIGRMKAQKTRSKYAQHKSMGTKLSSDRLALISKQISGKADVVIKDLYTDAGDPSGTLVELNIPITYFEN
jgi:LytS/YehU family sensor histidine kinase